MSMLADVCQGLLDPVQWVLDHRTHPFRDDRECLSAEGAWNVAELITIRVFPLVRYLKNVPF